jgi:hypothetical protein
LELLYRMFKTEGNLSKFTNSYSTTTFSCRKRPSVREVVMASAPFLSFCLRRPSGGGLAALESLVA